MDENVQLQDELSLSEIFKILLRKVKTLVIVLLCGIIAGAGVAVLRTFNTKYYGTMVSFYINPRLDKASSTEVESQYGVYGAYGMHVMNNMVLLLGSELFSEQLLLDKSGLPSDELLASLNNTDLNAKVEAAKTAQTAAQEKVDATNAILKILNEENTKVSTLNTEVNTLWAAYRNANPDKINLTSTPTRIDGEETLNKAITDLENAKVSVALYKEQYNAADKEAQSYLDTADKAVEAALEIWRTADKAYKDKMEAVSKAISYSYTEKEVKETENVNDLARSFVYVEISVLNDKDFANYLLNRIREQIPLFIEENMPVPSGYDGTNCQRITRLDSIENTNAGYMFTSMIKYGILLGAAAFIVACVAVIIIDRSNKKLTDYEQTMEKFRMPVLGVIPSISYKEEQEKTEVNA